MTRILLRFLTIIGLLSFVVSCKSDRRTASTLTDLNPYIYAYTSGVISKSEPVVVRFAQEVVPADEVGKPVARGIFSIAPNVSGSAYWEDERTLRFEPESNFRSGTAYRARLNLRQFLKEVKREYRQFNFDFQVRDQYLEVNLIGIRPARENDLSVQQLEGTLYTSDLADIETVEQSLKALQGKRQLPITWESKTPKQHHFTIGEIERGETENTVTITWTGKPFGTNQQGESTYTIPSINEFRVIRAEVVSGPDTYVRIAFSDPLAHQQNLDGLINLSSTQPIDFRTLIDGNLVLIYPSRIETSSAVDLNIYKGIKNVAGKNLTAPSDWQLNFSTIEPQVRLVGRGVILPQSENLLFPFEATGLEAVDVEVFKIFDNNILQYLQNNRLSEGYGLYQVGRIIMRQKVDLRQLTSEYNQNKWVRYALDLRELLAEDKEAIFQIRIGFRPEYASYNCPEAGQVVYSGSGAMDYDDLGKSIMDTYYGPAGYYDGYDYNDREDPCRPAYYNRDRFIQRNVIASNLGLIAKIGTDDKAFVAVTDLRTAQPVSGAEVTVYDYQQQPIASAKTAGDGTVSLPLDRPAFVVMARTAGERGYLRVQDMDALQLSTFDLSGVQVQEGLKGYLYAERDVWRPGDSIFLNFVLEDRDNRLPDNYPIELEITNARGQLVENRRTNDNQNGIYPLFLSTAPEAPTGNWIARVKAGGAAFEKILKVETIKPNRLKIDLDFGSESLSRSTAPQQAILAANWLHGAPASNLRAVVECRLRSATPDFENFPGYTFSDVVRAYDGYSQVLLDEKLDAEGKTAFKATLMENDDVPGPMKAIFETRVFEQGGDFSTEYLTFPYHPFEAYAGIKIPKNDYGFPRLEIEQAGRLDFALADKNGAPLTNRSLEVELLRVEWRWWWEEGYDNIARYLNNYGYTYREAHNVRTDANGKASLLVNLSDWGRYLVRVCDPRDGHCAGDFLYVGYPFYGSDAPPEMAAMLSLRTDREVYEVGQQVQITIPSAENGRALVTLENGSGVVRSWWEETVAGEHAITFRATADMVPNVYAYVTLIQPHNQRNNDLPIRLYGVAPLEVEDPKTQLNPVADFPDELRPNQSFEITVNEAQGRSMAYTVAVVDEGLLGLTQFQTPNPHEAFFAREALGVRSWDVYDLVLGAYGGEINRLLQIGGDGAAIDAALGNNANRFEPVVRHLGPFYLPGGQKAKHKIQLPNYVGAVRAMVVAVGDGKYGAYEKTASVKQPLMVLGSLPRVLGPGERVELPVNVFVNSDALGTVEVSASASGGSVDWVEAPEGRLNFAGSGNQLQTFTFETGDQTGPVIFEIRAAGGGETATQSITVEVRNPNPTATQVQEKILDPGAVWSAGYTPLGMPGTRNALMEVSTIPPINLGKRLRYLLQYPYGCIEQTISAGFPQLYVDRLMELSVEQQAAIPNRVRATIDRLRQFQLANGGFTYWPGAGRSDPWSSNYAGHFLMEAQRQGYTVPELMLKKWTDFQEKAAQQWQPNNLTAGFTSNRNHQLDQAYRLFTLAQAGKPEQAAMNRLRSIDGLSNVARWQLAATYALIGQENVGRQLVEKADPNVQDYRELSQTYGSGLRDQAFILQAMVLLGQEDAARQLLQKVSQSLGSTQWLSTQTTAQALLAVTTFLGETPTQSGPNFRYAIDGRGPVDGGSDRPLMQVDLPTGGDRQNLQLTNQGEGKLFARLILSGKPLPGNEEADSENLKLSVAYKHMDGAPLAIEELDQGTDFYAEVVVVHPGTMPISYKELALEQVFPSGWEIINTRLANGNNLRNLDSPYDYQDIRDDRVQTFFDLREGEVKTFRVKLNAAYLGRYYLPGPQCQAMYDRSIRARDKGQWVNVVLPGGPVQ